MTGELGARYYRLALAEAGRRNLTRAVEHGEHALLLLGDGEPEAGLRDRAERLVRLCRLERGDPLPDGGERESRGYDRLRELAAAGKWKAAARFADTLPRDSVRALLIQGCAHAAAKGYAKAADRFALALERDRGCPLAARGLAEAVKRRKTWLGGLL